MIVSSAFDGFGDDGNIVRLPLKASRVRLPDPRTIAPRPWLYGTHLMRGFVSLLVSPGGVGKSQLAMAMAVSVARGKGILGHYVHHQANAWLLNLEDPLDEMERRLAALMVHHDIPASELAETLYMDSGRDRKLCMAELDKDGNTILFPDKEAVITTARACNIGFIAVDPFIKSHSLEENSNPHMDAAATAWAEVATEVNAAALIVHHVRKGPVTDIDSARGGSALKDAARMAVLLSPMSPEEGERMGIGEVDRWRHIRLDDGKANMAPRAERADWMVMHQVQLGNATAEYPNGDTVTALAPWTPPDAAGDASMGDVVAVLERIQAGPAEGELYSPSARGRDNSRWVGAVVMEAMGFAKGQASRLVDAWFKAGLLLETEFHSAAQRKTRAGVRVHAGKLVDMKSGVWSPPLGDV